MVTDDVRERALALMTSDPWGREQWQRLADGDVATAVEHLETAVRLSPGMARAWSDLGVALRRQGENERALDAHERSMALAVAAD